MQIKNKADHKLIDKLKSVDWEFQKDDTDFATHNIHRYSSKYIPQIPEKLITHLTKENDIILDPFLGSGTTLVEANRLKRNSIGVDMGPVAILISKAKTTCINENELDREIKRFIEVISTKVALLRSKIEKNRKLKNFTQDLSYKLPAFNRSLDWYQPNVLKELALIKDYINQEIKDPRIKIFFTCAFSAIVRPVSNAASGYGNLMIDKEKRLIENTFELYERQLLKMRESIIELSRIYNHKNSIDIVQSDSRKLDFIKDNSVDCIITHPPYVSAVPYAEYLMLSLLWLEDSFSYLFDEKIKSNLNFKHLDEFIIGGKRNKKDVVERFESDMSAVFKEMFRVLKKGSYCAIVIGNPVVKGKLIKCDEMFIEIAQNVGFSTVANIQRGKYKTTMGKMKEEFILIFRK